MENIVERCVIVSHDIGVGARVAAVSRELGKRIDLAHTTNNIKKNEEVLCLLLDLKYGEKFVSAKYAIGISKKLGGDGVTT